MKQHYLVLECRNVVGVQYFMNNHLTLMHRDANRLLWMFVHIPLDCHQ
jgi:hypothetical protein